MYRLNGSMFSKLLLVLVFLVLFLPSVKLGLCDSNTTGTAEVLDPFVPVDFDPDKFRFDPFGLAKQYEGNLFGFIFAIFYLSIGDFFMMGLIFIPCIAFYMRYRSITVPCFILAVFGGSLVWLLPVSVMRIQFLFLGLGVAGILYKLFGERG